MCGVIRNRGKWMVSQGGGIIPQWQGDGRALYWVTPDGVLMAAEVKPGPTELETGKPEALPRTRNSGVPLVPALQRGEALSGTGVRRRRRA